MAAAVAYNHVHIHLNKTSLIKRLEIELALSACLSPEVDYSLSIKERKGPSVGLSLFVLNGMVFLGFFVALISTLALNPNDVWIGGASALVVLIGGAVFRFLRKRRHVWKKNLEESIGVPRVEEELRMLRVLER